MKYLSLLPVILIMAAIFCFSSQPASESSGTSGSVVSAILTVAEQAFGFHWTEDEKALYGEKIHTPVRKLAHMTAYAVLAVSMAFALYSWGLQGHRLYSGTELFCILYAAADEFHQLFVPGRSGEFKDVLIDSAGSLAGCLVFAVLLWLLVKWKNCVAMKQSKHEGSGI